MAEQILSPGVFQNESDQSLVQRGIQGTATARRKRIPGL